MHGSFNPPSLRFIEEAIEAERLDSLAKTLQPVNGWNLNLGLLESTVDTGPHCYQYLWVCLMQGLHAPGGHGLCFMFLFNLNLALG